MKKLIGWTALLAGLVVPIVAATAFATLASGVTSTTIAAGNLDEINVESEQCLRVEPLRGELNRCTSRWKAELKTEGQTQISVSENRVAPGGHFGWHSHPGPSLVIVKSGTSTFYSADDPNCTPHVHPAGTAYVDPGGGVHIARNEGTVDLVVIVTRLIPAGAPARIDEPNPGNCPF